MISAFSSVVGHNLQVAALKEMHSRGRIPHALLFIGPSGVGKRTVAHAFAEELLCGSDESSNDESTSSLFKAGNHPDFHIAFREEGKRDLPVETIRTLCGKLQLKPYYGRNTLAIIDAAETMNIAASNALLMTLEEPVQNTYIILVTSAPQRLPETIVSRCQKLQFGGLTKSELMEVIARVLGPIISAETQKALVEFCENSLAPLSLDRFTAPRTLRLENEKECALHLEQFLSTVRNMEEQFESFCNTASRDLNNGASHAALLATALTGDKEREPLVWQTMHRVLRSRMRSGSNEEKGRWANALLSSLEAEQLCRERNTSSQLQLGSVMLGTLLGKVD